VILEQTPTADGQAWEVTYLRRLVEKRVVNELYRMAPNEHGQLMPTKLAIASPRVAASF
jgi:hypothetical protein